MRRNTSVHAAAIVITPGDLTDHIPLSREKDVTTTQFAGEDLGELGLLKMDILGLRTLSVVQKALQLIEARSGAEAANALALERIPLDDANTFTMLVSRAVGVFQLDSTGMRDLLRKLRPTEIEDIIALISLYRPGPMKAGMVDEFVRRKHGREKVAYDHPLLEPILKTTFGTMVYQEQIMKIAMAVGGFTPGQADTLRKAMGKKRPEEMEKPRASFLEGARTRGVNAKTANRIFDNM
ncbi:MAG: DNA polymerase III subunit alpha, partial [bacterium]